MVSEFKTFCFIIPLIVGFTSETSAKLRSIVLKMILTNFYMCVLYIEKIFLITRMKRNTCTLIELNRIKQTQ